jgi:hypothetical protein
VYAVLLLCFLLSVSLALSHIVNSQQTKQNKTKQQTNNNTNTRSYPSSITNLFDQQRQFHTLEEAMTSEHKAGAEPLAVEAAEAERLAMTQAVETHAAFRESRWLDVVSNAVWVKEKTMWYLGQQAGSTQHAAAITAFVKAYQDAKLMDLILTKDELVSVIDLRPTKLVLLQRIIFEGRAPDSVSEESLNALIELIETPLPAPPEVDPDAADDLEDGGDYFDDDEGDEGDDLLQQHNYHEGEGADDEDDVRMGDRSSAMAIGTAAEIDANDGEEELLPGEKKK